MILGAVGKAALVFVVVVYKNVPHVSMTSFWWIFILLDFWLCIIMNFLENIRKQNKQAKVLTPRK